MPPRAALGQGRMWGSVFALQWANSDARLGRYTRQQDDFALSR